MLLSPSAWFSHADFIVIGNIGTFFCVNEYQSKWWGSKEDTKYSHGCCYGNYLRTSLSNLVLDDKDYIWIPVSAKTYILELFHILR